MGVKGKGKDKNIGKGKEPDREIKQQEKINRVSVNILNEEYIIKGNAETKHIEKVASYVDAQMRHLALKHPSLTPDKVAVLAAVNITDEYFRLKENYEALIKLLDEDKK